MSNHLPSYIVNLIKQKAYASGKLNRLKRQFQRENAKFIALENMYLAAKNDLVNLEQEILAAKAGLNEIEVVISKAAPMLDVTDIRSIEHRPKTSHLPFGEISRAIVEIFLAANGRPLTTGEIRDLMVEQLKLPNITAKDRNDTYERISKRLRFYAGRGIIKRLHAPDYGVRMGVWLWVGMD